jgi:hypothetical protein
MGRKKQEGENSTEVVAVERMQEDITTAEELYGDGMPYELDRLENEIRFYQEQTGFSLIEMGKRFIRIKAHEEHGRFMKAIENVGMTDRSVRYAMLAAKKFSNRKAISDLGPTKMIALSVLDEDEIQVLEDGGDVSGMKLDDIDRMTTRELRRNLREKDEKLRAEKEARKQERDIQEQVIRQKEAKINELERQLRYQQPPTQEQRAQSQLDERIHEYRIALLEAVGGLQKTVILLTRAECIEGVNIQQLNEWLNQFNPEMCLLDEVHKELIAMVDRPTVIEPFDFDGEKSADVPDVC